MHAIVNAGPREDSTRVGAGGIVRRQVSSRAVIPLTCRARVLCAASSPTPGLQLFPRAQAVDVSPFRRVNQALYLIGMGAREASFRTIKTIAECLADEIFNAAKGSSNSYSIKKKVRFGARALAGEDKKTTPRASPPLAGACPSPTPHSQDEIERVSKANR